MGYSTKHCVFTAAEAPFLVSQYVSSSWEGFSEVSHITKKGVFIEGRGRQKAERSIIFLLLECTLRPMKKGLKSCKWIISCNSKTLFQLTHKGEGEKAATCQSLHE